MQTAIEKIVNHAAKIKAGEIEQVKPGMPIAFTDACVAGDTIRQGDLYLVIVADVPKGYAEVTKPTKADRQLVPGNTEGSRHCLDSLAGVKMYRPAKWDEESLDGPCLVLTKARKVLHPTHGTALLPAGFTVVCKYQREFNKEQQKALRARD
jgi:hypothetical protein